MAASNAQVQNFVDQQIRPFAEAVRALYFQGLTIKSLIDDVYANLTAGGGSTWTDNRTDGPPHLLTPADVLAVNSWLTSLLSGITTQSSDGNLAALNGQFPVIEKACVR